MLLNELYKEFDLEIEITGIASDTRYVKPGYLFIPIPGIKYSGEEFFIDAINKGCKVIVYNKEVFHLDVPIIIVNDSYAELKRLLKLFYNEPYNDLKMIGITGTDGKTSTAIFCNHLLNYLNSSSYIGTNGIHYQNEIYPTSFTTEPLAENYRLLDYFKENNVKYVCMEASSQGLLAKRLDTILFDYTVFTNLSVEHLDTHKTMANYFNSKLELFKQMKPQGTIIVNKDDNYAKFFNDFDQVIYYSLFTPSDYQAINIRYYNGYTMFDLLTKDTIYQNLLINRQEEYNIYNILPGIIISLKEGIYLPYIYKALKDLPIVSGRLEKVPLKYPFEVYIDFAHTPGGLKAVLSSLKQKANGNLILVCGSAGNKDKIKRPLMGEIACSICDKVIFTSEDPRDEDPMMIINDLIKDIKTSNYQIIVDRKKALTEALKLAKEHDIVIVTGKGRETFFEEKGISYQYSDFDYLLNSISLQDNNLQ